MFRTEPGGLDSANRFMNNLTPQTKLSRTLAIAVFSFSVFDAPSFGGITGPPGNGGLQIVFSDDGNGKTAITAIASRVEKLALCAFAISM